MKPAFKGYPPPNCGGDEGYPNTLGVSLNDEVIHGIPYDRTIQEGDVVKLGTSKLATAVRLRRRCKPVHNSCGQRLSLFQCRSLGTNAGTPTF